MKLFIGLLTSVCLVIGFPALSAKYRLPDDGSRIVGQMRSVIAKKGDTLTRLAMRYGVGYNEIRHANPQYRKKYLPVGGEVLIPMRHQIPDGARDGIIINTAAMRLYYFPDPNTVVTYPIAVGKRGWSTPRGYTRIVAKKKHPTWTPPPSIIREAARRGRKLRKVYRAGPNNPLGTRALRLGIPGILIHGTNKPWTIGQRRSHGCIRMRRQDVESLFDMVSVGTPVRIINQRFEPVEYVQQRSESTISEGVNVTQVEKEEKFSRSNQSQRGLVTPITTADSPDYESAYSGADGMPIPTDIVDVSPISAKLRNQSSDAPPLLSVDNQTTFNTYDERSLMPTEIEWTNSSD